MLRATPWSRCWHGWIASAEPSAPSSLTPALGCGRRRQTASPSSSRASWRSAGSGFLAPTLHHLLQYHRRLRPRGLRAAGAKLDEVVGVVKAYSSCVGEGPFTCEWFGPEAEELREAGDEYGAKTGRPRRVGPIDLVASRYGVRMQGATNIAFTKLDVLSYMERIPVCAAYEVDGQITHEFPFPVLLDQAKPVTEYLPGWHCDISGVRTWADLPQAARDYVTYVEQAIGPPHWLRLRGR